MFPDSFSSGAESKESICPLVFTSTNGQGRVIFLTRSSGKTSDNQKSDFMRYSIFLPNGKSGKLQTLTAEFPLGFAVVAICGKFFKVAHENAYLQK